MASNKKSRKEVEVLASAIGVIGSFVGSLVELVKEFAGSLEPIYWLVTPSGAATLKKMALIAVEDWKGVLVVTTYKVADCFPKPLFYSRDGDLDAWLPTTLPNLPAGKPTHLVTNEGETFRQMAERELNIVGQNKTDAEIQRLLVEKQKCFSLKQIEETVVRHQAGDKSFGLRDDNWANFFFVEGADGVVFVVDVSRYSDGWYVYVDSFDWHRWGAGRLVFFRN